MNKLQNFDALFDITTDTSKIKLKQEKNFLLYYSAKWCAPCKVASLELENINKDITSVEMFKIDVDETPELASYFDVRALPTFIVINKHAKTAVMVGWSGKEKFKSFLIHSLTNEVTYDSDTKESMDQTH